MFIKKLLKYIIHEIHNYFYITGKPKLINPIFYLRYIQNIRDKKKLAIFLEDDKYVNNKITTGCSCTDYNKIVDLIIDNKPINICEFGSGISTIIAAKALKINFEKFQIKGKIFSYEEDLSFYENTKKMISETMLDDYIELIYSPTNYKTYESFLGAYYEKFDLKKKYQLFIVDGPQLKRKNKIKPFDADLFRYFNKYPDYNFITFLDKRIHTLRVLKKLISGVTFDYNNIYESTFIKN